MQVPAERKASPDHGSGLYQRGNVYWLKARTPARYANHIPKVFWRFSLQTNFRREALCAARSVRAALDTGFVLVGVAMQYGVFTEAEGTAFIAALARRALDEAEARRALSGLRSDDDIRLAKQIHLAEANQWRDALRRNDLASVVPIVRSMADALGINWHLRQG